MSETRTHYETEEIDLDTEQDALVWIINNQLGQAEHNGLPERRACPEKKDILLKKKGKKQQGRRIGHSVHRGQKVTSHSTRDEMG